MEKWEMDLDEIRNGLIFICLGTTSVNHSLFGKVVRPSERGEMRSDCEVSDFQLRGAGDFNVR
jgi:hypothetical protein